MASLVAAHLDDMKLLFLLLGYAAAFQVDLDGNGQFWMSWNFINSKKFSLWPPISLRHLTTVKNEGRKAIKC